MGKRILFERKIQRKKSIGTDCESGYVYFSQQNRCGTVPFGAVPAEGGAAGFLRKLRREMVKIAKKYAPAFDESAKNVYFDSNVFQDQER